MPQGVRVRVSPPAQIFLKSMNTVDDLLELLKLKKEDHFLGTSKTIGSNSVFGGQVLAQSLYAAYNSISNNRILHSLHSYFLERGDLETPIKYYVDQIRDGGSFQPEELPLNKRQNILF